MTSKDITIEDFIEKILMEIPDIKRENIGPHMKFRDHVEWDSVNALVLIAMVNVEYDVSLRAEELIKAETINDVFLVIKKKIEDKEQN